MKSIYLVSIAILTVLYSPSAVSGFFSPGMPGNASVIRNARERNIEQECQRFTYYEDYITCKAIRYDDASICKKINNTDYYNRCVELTRKK